MISLKKDRTRSKTCSLYLLDDIASAEKKNVFPENVLICDSISLMVVFFLRFDLFLSIQPIHDVLMVPLWRIREQIVENDRVI